MYGKRKRTGGYGRRVFRRRYRRTSRSFKRYRRRSSYRESKWKVGLGQIVPDTLYTKMRFKWFKSATASTTSPTYYTYELNDPYNPYSSIGDTSAFGFTEYAALYQNFVCFGSKMKCTFTSQSNTQTFIVVVPSVSSTAVTSPSTTQEFCDQTNAKSSTLAGNAQGFKTVKTISYYMPVAKLFGYPKQRPKNDGGFWGTNASSPTTLAYWHCGYWCVDGSTSVSVNITVDITYYVRWSARVRFTS